ncbi:MAG: hypothetical protein ACXVAX_09695 [Pseudobdellovibrio sp.]
MWKLFPRLVEERINSLLDEAEPNRMKAYQLYKSCQNENLWAESFETFNQNLRSFFSLPKSERSKSQFDYYLNRPMHKSLFSEFQLDFRNSNVNQISLTGAASWTHHMMRLNCKVKSQIISMDVIKKTFNYVTNPPPFEKAADIEFEDFCNAWKKVVLTVYGNQHDEELREILFQLQQLDNEQRILENESRFIPTVFLTQTEVDWVNDLASAAQDFNFLPKFPLSKGPQKNELVQLEKVVRLYSIVMADDRPELVQHRQSVRDTLLSRCEEIQKSRAK